MSLARREFLRYGGAVAAMAAISPGMVRSCQRATTNVIVMTADDMRYDHLPYLRKTPALFADGTTYLSCRLNVPACQPYRVGFLTGQYARRNGVYGSAQYLSDPSKTIGPWMQSAGFSTGMIGKYPYPYGGQKLTGWTTQRTLAGATEQDAYGYGVFDGTSTSHPADHQTTYLFGEALSFIRNSPQPWFCWVTPTDPHVPLVPRPQDRGDWLDVQWPLVDDDLVGKPSWMHGRSRDHE